MSTVSLVKGNDRKKNILKALELIRDDIKNSLKNKERILIKPNFVSTNIPLCATNVKCVEAIIEFMQDFEKPIIIAESPAIGTAVDGFRNYDYEYLEDKFGVKLMDLEKDGFEEIELDTSGFNLIRPKSIKVGISKMLLDKKNYIISSAVLKTHDTVIATLSLKNILMGAICKRDKAKMHGSIKDINIFLFKLAKILRPDLAVIDGFEGMEGNGPLYGTTVDTRCSIASIDCIAADRVGLEVMEINPDYVGYLNYCGNYGIGVFDLSKIKILGDKIDECKRKFKLNDTWKQQINWVC